MQALYLRLEENMQKTEQKGPHRSVPVVSVVVFSLASEHWESTAVNRCHLQVGLISTGTGFPERNFTVKVTNSDRSTKEFPPAICLLRTCWLYDKTFAFKLPPKCLRKQNTYIAFMCILTFEIWSEKQYSILKFLSY